MWIRNFFLFLMFIFNPQGYSIWVAAGAPCMSNIAINGQMSTDPQPACPYDASNVNPFLP